MLCDVTGSEPLEKQGQVIYFGNEIFLRGLQESRCNSRGKWKGLFMRFPPLKEMVMASSFYLGLQGSGGCVAGLCVALCVLTDC